MRKIWIWTEIESWEGKVWEILEEIVTPQVKEAIKRAPPNHFAEDDLSWLDTIILKKEGLDVDSKEFLADAIPTAFTHLRAVHGTRSEGVNSFKEHGILPLNPSDFHSLAREIFLTGAFPELNEDNLTKAIALVGQELREGRVYFETSEKELIDYCGHYMLYGSEYLTAIAANLGGSRDYRQVLKSRGKPLLLRCDVPIDLIPSFLILEFSGAAIALLFERMISPGCCPPNHGGGFFILNALPANCIVEHVTPVVKNDPLIGVW